MKFVKKLIRALAWRIRVYSKPFLKPFVELMELPAVENFVYRLTDWNFERKLKHKNLADASAPLVSIVVPIYNVEKYLSVCVKSALLQTHPNVKIILVDDGSTDNSGAIAKSFADRFENVELVTQKNAGLAAARNTGVKAIQKSDYLLFLDSDDVLPLRAVERYLKAIGDLNVAVGKPTRLKGLNLYKRHRELFRYAVTKTELLQSYKFLSDVTAWNKLMRFDFWKAGKYQFPVGFLYEDMALMTRVYAESGGFAVVNKTSYYWRSRVGGGSSITQERWQLKNLEHRLKAIEDTLTNLEELYPVSAETKELWDYYHWSAARFDINFYLPWVEHTDDKFFKTLQKTAYRLYGNIDKKFWAKVPDRYRAALQALVANDRPGVISAIKKAKLRVPAPTK